MKAQRSLLSVTLLLAAACSSGNSTSNPDLGSGSGDQGSSSDQGSGGDQDGGGDLGSVGQQGLQLLAGHAGGLGFADRAGTQARFYYPNALAADGIGNVYVADTYNHAIRRIVLASGAVSTVALTTDRTYGVA